MSDEPSRIVHQVAFRFAPEATVQEREGAIAALLAFEEQVQAMPGYCDFAVGVDLGLREGNADFAVLAVFDSVEAFQGYANDEVHQEIIATHIAPVIAERTAVQYEVK